MESIRASSVRLLTELRTIPPVGKASASILGVLVLAGGAYLVLPDFINLDSKPTVREMGKILLVAMIFPAICEELFFRGLLNLPQSVVSISISTVFFVTWHPVGARLFLPEAIPYFLDPRFLTMVAVFGVYFALIRKFTGSIWTSILCHWILVGLWKGLGGAQFLT